MDSLVHLTSSSFLSMLVLFFIISSKFRKNLMMKFIFPMKYCIYFLFLAKSINCVATTIFWSIGTHSLETMFPNNFPSCKEKCDFWDSRTIHISFIYWRFVLGETDVHHQNLKKMPHCLNIWQWTCTFTYKGYVHFHLESFPCIHQSKWHLVVLESTPRGCKCFIFLDILMHSCLITTWKPSTIDILLFPTTFCKIWSILGRG